MEEFGGTWSIVQYIKAVETDDEKLRQEVTGQILKYNEEDLQATWTVMEWLMKNGKGERDTNNIFLTNN